MNNCIYRVIKKNPGVCCSCVVWYMPTVFWIWLHNYLCMGDRSGKCEVRRILNNVVYKELKIPRWTWIKTSVSYSKNSTKIYEMFLAKRNWIFWGYKSINWLGSLGNHKLKGLGIVGWFICVKGEGFQIKLSLRIIGKGLRENDCDE